MNTIDKAELETALGFCEGKKALIALVDEVVLVGSYFQSRKFAVAEKNCPDREYFTDRVPVGNHTDPNRACCCSSHGDDFTLNEGDVCILLKKGSAYSMAEMGIIRKKSQ